MANQSDVFVGIDDRIRFMSAVLAATHYPAKVQKRHPHGTHSHARSTSKHLSAFSTHPAVLTLQNLLDQGAPLEAMFTFGLCLSFPSLELEIERLPAWVPPRWIMDLRHFRDVTNIQRLWREEDKLWQASLEEAQKVFAGVRFKEFLKPFVGEISDQLVFMPNIAYPSDHEIGIRLGTKLICLGPPRLAWGDNPPWPFDEDAAHIYRAALTQYGRMLLIQYLRTNADRLAEATKTPLPVSDQFSAMHPTWEDQFAALFVAGAVAIFLEDHMSAAEAKAYVLMERKAQGMTILPGTVSVLRRYLNERAAGRYNNLLDFLTIFPKHLRVAQKIATL